MATSTIKRAKTLREQLLEMHPGEDRFVDEKDYRKGYVRQLVCDLNAKGHSFEATEKEVIYGIKVIRNK